MTFEVELKYPVDEFQSLLNQIKSLNATSHQPIRQVDRYFNHPSRDFGETNEALRIRNIGEATHITYKGPLLDTIAKTRQEIELRLADSTNQQLGEMLTLLGFREVLAVAKSRTPISLTFENRDIEIVLDEVDGLGQFVELETLTNKADKEAARDSLLRLADQLGLENSTQRSYLEMLLELQPE